MNDNKGSTNCSVIHNNGDKYVVDKLVEISRKEGEAVYETKAVLAYLAKIKKRLELSEVEVSNQKMSLTAKDTEIRTQRIRLVERDEKIERMQGYRTDEIRDKRKAEAKASKLNAEKLEFMRIVKKRMTTYPMITPNGKLFKEIGNDYKAWKKAQK